MTNVYDLNAARRAGGLSARRVAMSDLPPCVSGFGEWALFRGAHSTLFGGATGTPTYAYEITARCEHGHRVAVRVLYDTAYATDMAISEVGRRMRRRHAAR